MAPAPPLPVGLVGIRMRFTVRFDTDAHGVASHQVQELLLLCFKDKVKRYWKRLVIESATKDAILAVNASNEQVQFPALHHLTDILKCLYCLLCCWPKSGGRLFDAFLPLTHTCLVTSERSILSRS
jgi:hypothetical protein